MFTRRYFPYFRWDFFQPTRRPDKVTSPENSSLMLKQLASPNQQGIHGWFGGSETTGTNCWLVGFIGIIVVNSG